jgi:VCBS repeat-containing protein
MKKNITAITLFLLACSPNVFSGFLFIDPPVTATTDTPATTIAPITNTTTTDTPTETPVEIIPPPQASNDFASLVIGVQTSTTGSVISNDLDTIGVTINGSLIGTYGALELKTTGEYTYTLFESGSGIDSLVKDQQVTDVFQYTAFNKVNEQSIGQLTIQLISKLSPAQATSTIAIARDDSVTVRANSIPTATGDVTSNDDSSTSSDTNSTTRSKSVQLNSSPNSQYGFLVLNVDGTFTYTLYDGSPSVSALKFGDTITDSFIYTYFDEFGQSASARLNVTIIGNPVDAAGNTIFNAANTEEPVDTFTIRDAGGTELPIITAKVTNRTTTNNANSIQLVGSPAREHGFLILNADGSFVYNLYRYAPEVLALKNNEIATDSFTYTYLDKFGQKTTAKLNITIIGHPLDAAGNTIFQQIGDGSIYDNVDIEFNDRSTQATPLNSSRKIRGHLHSSNDKDWYTLSSAGNEVITLEVCPRGSSCFGKKSWVLYVFDGDLLTAEQMKAMEETEITFGRWLDETGGRTDLSGTDIINGLSSAGTSNHMYLNYRKGIFSDTLIGVIDPCFDTSNSLDIGVGDGKKNYFFAVSSPLRGDGNVDGDTGCGAGDVILERPARSVIGLDAETPPAAKLYTSTEEYINVFPVSDDQYTIKVTGTGLHPLLSKAAQASSATYNPATGVLVLPKVRVYNELYRATLKPEDATITDKTKLVFVLDSLDSLGSDNVTDNFQATYDPNSKQVIIPRVTDTSDGKAYSVILQYFPAANGKIDTLEVLSFILIE